MHQTKRKGNIRFHENQKKVESQLLEEDEDYL